MAHRSSARWMAPLALIAAVAAVAIVVNATTGTDTDRPAATSERSDEGRTSTGRTTTARTTATTESAGPSSYTVKAGDTLGAIAEATGVSVPELQELNPGLDPQSLTVGERIKLR